MNRIGKRSTSTTMSGSGDIIGDLAQSALTARAVEPVHGESGDGHSTERACLNCGTALIGTHCHACGQAAHVHKTLGAFFHDLLHGVFHFEGKIWRTLPMLAWQPGRLTREYIDGRRASYVSPIALFLFSVFLMFAVIKQFGGSLDDLAQVNVNDKVIQGVAANEQELGRLRQQREVLVRQGKPTAAIDEEIGGRIEGLKVIKDTQAAFGNKDGAKQGKPHIYSDVPAINRMLESFRDNPGLGLYKLQANAYKYSWALIPISVPFVWLLFPFSRRFRLYDHTVFVTYSLCFMTLLVVLFTLTVVVQLPLLGGLALLVPPFHMYRQIKGTYGLSRGGALWRTAALVVFAETALVLFAVLILAESGS